MLEWLKQPWPWYIAGPLIGLTVPVLLLLGNKTFGISSSLRHICAICIPGKIPFFRYDWKKEAWNLFFVGGILLGGIVAAQWLANPAPVLVHPHLQEDLAAYGVTDYSGIVPGDIFSWQELFTPRGFIMIVVGGFMVGFGTRYAGGCTSGHAIMGLSNLQWPSLVATCCFMIGGFVMTWLILPYILQL
ncbi:YeeE/YedE family protein [Agriterribacter sp.]|uniref:YeeE/YedE family protein n=1 Tax=Agriterribacter sp. TaxID=2821509 RepID=UPI002B6B861B|nr:YeeE/YedE thiosulfate transporter family protein [Agriterribacter sp.]HTN09129.1 YeeE/YedE thiosulfate transporter family protein [Agriterribacter sp.]